MGTPVVINADALRKAVLELASFLDQHSDMLPRTYEHKVERIDGVENMHFGFSTGGMSGIRLPGDSEHVYVIHSGLNKCTLQKIGINNEGRGYIIETRDVRKVKKIETANMGMLSIRSRRAKSELRRALKDIVEFLDRTSGDTVEKVVT